MRERKKGEQQERAAQHHRGQSSDLMGALHAAEIAQGQET
jgi:hypothetical protein